MAKSPKAGKETTSEEAPLLPREPDTEKGQQAREIGRASCRERV